MKKKSQLVGLVLGIPALAMLPGCASINNVEDVTVDKVAYQAKHFSSQRLAPSLARKLPVPPPGPAAAKLVIVGEMTSEGSDGKKETWTSEITYTNAGQGLVQKMEEESNNGIPYLLTYSLSYLGLLDLRWQHVPLRSRTTRMMFEVNDISRFDPLPLSGSGEAVIEYRSGSEAQIANFIPVRRTCTATRTMQASALHAKLAGMATELECTNILNNVPQSRGKWVFLRDYGTAVLMETTNSAYKKTYRIVDVKTS